jgi:hypothetical protein
MSFWMIALVALLGGTAPAPAAEKWVSLFDGKSLGGWKKTEFAAAGEVKLEPSFRGKGPAIVVEMGDMLGGVHWGSESAKAVEIPKTNYEIEVEFLKIDGNDFALGLTFPVGDSHASLILGGWGGATVGVSSLDDKDASQNETTQYLQFKKDRWYKARVRVTPDKLEAWLDKKKIVSQSIKDRKITLRSGEISRAIPLGLSTFRTSAAYRGIRLRRL